MRKKVIYNDTAVIAIEPESSEYSTVEEGQYVVVQTLPLVKQMLQTRGIDTSLIDSYQE